MPSGWIPTNTVVDLYIVQVGQKEKRQEDIRL